MLKRIGRFQSIPKQFLTNKIYLPSLHKCIHTETPKPPEKTEWTPIYKLPFITTIAGINKLKIYQAAVTALAVPIVMGFEAATVLSPNTAEMVGVIGRYAPYIKCMRVL